jgi:hypothetical protein
MARCRGPAGRHVAARRYIAARRSIAAKRSIAAQRYIAAQHDIMAQRGLKVRCVRLGPAAPPAAAPRSLVPRQRFRRAPLIRAGAGTVAAAAPRAGGLTGHGCTWAGRHRIGARLGTPAARPCDAGCPGRPAAAVPVRDLPPWAETGFSARPFRSGRPWGPGWAARRRARAACGIRPCPAVSARPAPRLWRAVRPGPRPEPGIGARAEPGLRAATGPRICSRSGPAAAWLRTGIRPGAGARPQAKILIGMPGPPRARGVLRGLRARRGGERYAGCRTIARWPHPASTRFRAPARTTATAR